MDLWRFTGVVDVLLEMKDKALFCGGTGEAGYMLYRSLFGFFFETKSNSTEMWKTPRGILLL